jgi:hypothetical protein
MVSTILEFTLPPTLPVYEFNPPEACPNVQVPIVPMASYRHRLLDYHQVLLWQRDLGREESFRDGTTCGQLPIDQTTTQYYNPCAKIFRIILRRPKFKKIACYVLHMTFDKIRLWNNDSLKSDIALTLKVAFRADVQRFTLNAYDGLSWHRIY